MAIVTAIQILTRLEDGTHTVLKTGETVPALIVGEVERLTRLGAISDPAADAAAAAQAAQVAADAAATAQGVADEAAKAAAA